MRTPAIPKETNDSLLDTLDSYYDPFATTQEKLSKRLRTQRDSAVQRQEKAEHFVL